MTLLTEPWSSPLYLKHSVGHREEGAGELGAVRDRGYRGDPAGPGRDQVRQGQQQHTQHDLRVAGGQYTPGRGDNQMNIVHLNKG